MKKILFVCHGNICRSVAAEFVFKHHVKLNNLENKFYCESRATSREEIGNNIYPPMQKTLKLHNVSYERHYASQITYHDYLEYDLILLMDQENLYGIQFIIPNDNLNKIKLLTNYVGLTGEIEDPWYSGHYEKVYQQIDKCCRLLIEKLS